MLDEIGDVVDLPVAEPIRWVEVASEQHVARFVVAGLPGLEQVAVDGIVELRHAPSVEHGSTPAGHGARLWLLGFALLGACDAGEDVDGEVPPTFTEVHQRVLQVSCVFSTCHTSGPSPAGEMTLERDVAHANLVDVPSPAIAQKLRVVAVSRGGPRARAPG